MHTFHGILPVLSCFGALGGGLFCLWGWNHVGHADVSAPQVLDSGKRYYGTGVGVTSRNGNNRKRRRFVAFLGVGGRFLSSERGNARSLAFQAWRGHNDGLSPPSGSRIAASTRRGCTMTDKPKSHLTLYIAVAIKASLEQMQNFDVQSLPRRLFMGSGTTPTNGS